MRFVAGPTKLYKQSNFVVASTPQGVPVVHLVTPPLNGQCFLEKSTTCRFVRSPVRKRTRIRRAGLAVPAIPRPPCRSYTVSRTARNAHRPRRTIRTNHAGRAEPLLGRERASAAPAASATGAAPASGHKKIGGRSPRDQTLEFSVTNPRSISSFSTSLGSPDIGPLYTGPS